MQDYDMLQWHQACVLLRALRGHSSIASEIYIGWCSSWLKTSPGPHAIERLPQVAPVGGCKRRAMSHGETPWGCQGWVLTSQSLSHQPQTVSRTRRGAPWANTNTGFRVDLWWQARKSRLHAWALISRVCGQAQLPQGCNRAQTTNCNSLSLKEAHTKKTRDSPC